VADETSIWKKEISFRRKPKPAAAELAQPAVEAAPAQPAETSVWKKEISFKRKPAAAPVEPQPEWLGSRSPQPAAEPVVPPPLPGEVTPPVLPPVTPQPVSTPSPPPAQPPVTPAPPQPQPLPSAPEPEPEFELPAAEAPQPQVPVAAAPVVPVAPEAPRPAVASEPAPAPAPDLSRKERKEQKREAARLEKEQQKLAKKAGKTDKTASQLVGLKIGASQIAAAQLINKGGPRIVRMARMPLRRGIVVGGELREPEELTTALKAFFKQNKLPRTNVRLGISNNRIGVRTFEVAGIEDPKQLANAVRYRAQETLPIPLDEAVLDHRILDDRVDAEGARVCRVLLVVAHKELVERYADACRKAGLKLAGIDLEAFALLRALSDPTRPPGDDAAVVCVSIGHDRSTLAVSDGRICEFTRVLAWGGSALDAAIARVLDQTPSQVVPIKHALALDQEGEAAGLDAQHADEARRAMRVELQSFARELVASLRFYQEQQSSLGIVEILITGGAAACGGLADELERLIGIPVRVADPLARVSVPKRVPGDGVVSTASMAIAVGLGIED
jgi:type IV pilus assembly protein PilM